jgi:large subunit ribosomal protein LP2
MKELAAYLLLVLSGKDSITSEDISAVVVAAGAEADDDKITALLKDLDGKDIHELLEKGDNDLKSVVGVAGPVAAG